MEENRLGGDRNDTPFGTKLLMMGAYAYILIALVVAYNLTNVFIEKHGWILWAAGGFIWCSIKALFWIFWIWF